MTTFADVPSTKDLIELMSSVWESFLGDALEPVTLDAAAGKTATHNELVASVSIIGEWSGQFFLAGTHACGKDVAKQMFGLDDGDVGEEEVADAFGELANVIGGNVKSMLAGPSSLSLPQVIVDAHRLSVPSAQLRTVAVVSWLDHQIVASLWEAPSSTPTGGTSVSSPSPAYPCSALAT